MSTKTYANTELLNLFEHYLDQEALKGFPDVLLKSTRHILQMKGKRIRPIMVLTACQVFGGDIHQAMGPAGAVEIFHNFSLVHDDIIDEADKRRGKPTVHKVFGLHKAILTGDAMLLHAFMQLRNSPDNKLNDLLRVFNKAASEVIEGEQHDVDFESIPEVSEEAYLLMIKLKTSVLLAASLQLGAIVGGASLEDQKHIYDFGLNLGLAFQIKDDYLDSYGDGEKFGKRIGGDIVQNKKTYLLITALKNATRTDRQEIFELFEEKNDTIKIEKMIAVFNRLKVNSQTFAKMETFYKKSLQSLSQLSISESDRLPLYELAEMVYQRDH